MNQTELFDALIKLQYYGYGIYSVEKDESGNYFIKFAFPDVCSGLAFGGIQYEIHFYPTISKYLLKKLTRNRDNNGFFQESFSIDEAVDFIIADIQEIEAEEIKKERQKILDKLTPKEREILGIKE